MKKIYFLTFLFLTAFVVSCEKVTEENKVQPETVDNPKNYFPEEMLEVLEERGHDPSEVFENLRVRTQRDGIDLRGVEKSTSTISRSFITECPEVAAIPMPMEFLGINYYSTAPKGACAYSIIPYLHLNPFVDILFTSRRDGTIFNCLSSANSDCGIPTEDCQVYIVKEGEGNFTPAQLIVNDIVDTFYFDYPYRDQVYRLDGIAINTDGWSIYLVENLDYPDNIGWSCGIIPLRLILPSNYAIVGERLEFWIECAE